MNYCSNCGIDINPDQRFCSNCGKNFIESDNFIDKNVDKLRQTTQKHYSSIKKEISESQTIKEIDTKMQSLIWNISIVFGWIGILIIIGQIMHALITGTDPLISRVHREALYNPSEYGYTFDMLTINFIPIFLPIIFITVASVKKRYFIFIGVLVLVIFALIAD